ncbi:hypothetical protein F4779DRAFT_154251 [Xylariaceae sp. FL0662B]|nr:hypothetical protein F4779DRAFT_154251 [Xylariaceae sp. FL0662B]
MKSMTFLRFLALAATAYAWGPFDFGSSNDDDGGTSWPGIGTGNSGSGFGDSDPGSDYGYGAGGSADRIPGFDVREASRLRTIHGILAAVAFAVLFPVGSVFMRTVPGPLAWLVHAATQITAYLLYVAAAGLGLYLVSVVRMPPGGTSLLNMASMNAHPIIGIIVLAVLFFQPVLGAVHHAKFKRLKRRTWWSHAHIWVGRITLTLGIINGGLGLRLAGAPNDAKTAYGVVAALMWLLWAATVVLAETRRRCAPEATQRVKERATDDPSPPYTPSPRHGERSIPDVGPEGPIELRSVDRGSGRAVGSVIRSRSVSPLSPEHFGRGQV